MNKGAPKRSLEESLSRVHLFDDSGEISEGLLKEAEVHEQAGQYSYWEREAAEHIDGMWQLVQELEYHLKQSLTAKRSA